MDKAFEQNQINNIINKFDKKENELSDLPKIEKELPFNKRLDELFKNSVFIESEDGKKYILQNGTRIAVIADVKGVRIPFYQSSGGTGGKISGTPKRKTAICSCGKENSFGDRIRTD